MATCGQCQQTQKVPPLSPLHPWEWPTRPWARVHADYAGPISGKMLLVLVDAYSKWVEALVVSSANSQSTIEKMRNVFAAFGIPEILVTDNGTPFTSEEFRQFAKRNGIRHIRSAPYHPATNGQAERAIQTLKAALKKADGGSLETKPACVLFNYRLTPNSTTGVTPAKLLLGRQPRSHLDMFRPSLTRRVECSLERQIRGHDKRVTEREFREGDYVLVKNFATGPTWLRGVIICERGSRTFEIRLDDGRELRRHIDHIRKCVVDPERSRSPAAQSRDDFGLDLPWDFPLPPTESESPPALPLANPDLFPTQPRRSTRVHRPPDRFGH